MTLCNHMIDKRNIQPSYTAKYMKKLVLILTLAAFACSPLMQTEVKAEPGVKTIAVKNVKKHHKKAKKQHKKHGKAA
ncbi:MAG: hypothetical protein JWR26_2841 [Pedosphaera sp.]|nr:hypothetical protein [Pedosphaera sp.]